MVGTGTSANGDPARASLEQGVHLRLRATRGSVRRPKGVVLDGERLEEVPAGDGRRLWWR